MISVWSAIVVALGLTAADDARTNPPPVRMPNVLFLMVDDLNDWVGCLGGHPQARTPRIDALARRGTLFTNAHCQAPLCNPSRTSILTGLRPTTTGVYALQPGFRKSPVLKDWVTMPQAFRDAGYRNYLAGKVFHDGAIPPDARRREAEDWGDPGTPLLPPTKRVDTPAKMAVMDWGVFPEPGRDADQGDWKIADAAIARMQRIPATDSYFIAAGFRLPHVPCFASQSWFDLYPEATLSLPPVRPDDRADVPDFAWYLHWKLPEPRLSWLERNGQWRNLVRSYLASISFIDSQVGRVLDALDASGRAGETIVVLLSDHGWHLGEKGITGKNTLWERSTRVPLILAGPGITAGARCAEPVELLDLYPTLLDLAGLSTEQKLEGFSLRAQLRDPAAPRSRPAVTTHNPGNHAVRDRRWRLIRYADGSSELYDHQTDPNEWDNRANDPAMAATIATLERHLPENEAAPVPGSAGRLLIKGADGGWIWEGKPIRREELDR